MKRIIITLAMSALLFSCSSGPEKAAKNFTENIAKGKIEEAKQYATESTGTMLDFASSFGGVKIDPNFEFKMIKDSIDNNIAWVTFINQKGREETIKMVKIDGDWLVHMDSKK
ncbi:DUF4878 domain-containing protein [Ancylomarina sp. 16SWW S1-10-2]|uniref:DUF4878 domain-containing protein n=1 Tax=Ancylomarina sp. 16SWW S1-10-2 TaxID=2499681 RepID=UPI0012AD94AC|nr:DUF4878 domain-containing protein [Ancylomarina sp. 16SWW S1-10-2]MRT92086.1 DUF4878 domain-containing protein [Ancylomarina sp. 16SWW S1-10-2]